MLFYPLRELSLDEISNDFGFLFLDNNDAQLEYRGLESNAVQSYREAWLEIGKKIGAEYEKPDDTDINADTKAWWHSWKYCIKFRGYFKFNSSEYHAEPIRETRINFYYDVWNREDAYTDHVGHYETTSKLVWNRVYKVTLYLESHYAEAPDFIYTTTVWAPEVNSKIADFHLLESTHLKNTSLSGIPDLFTKIWEAHEFAVRKGLFRWDDSAIRDKLNIYVNMNNSVMGETYYNWTGGNNYITIGHNWVTDSAVISHEYGHFIYHRKRFSNYEDAVYKRFYYLPDGEVLFTSQQTFMNEGWAMCFSTAFCQELYQSFMHTDGVLMWIENNFGSPEIIYKSVQNTHDFSTQIGQGIKNGNRYFLYAYNVLFQYHYASILWDLYDDNSHPQYTGTNTGPRGSAINSYQYTNSIYESYRSYFGQFSSASVNSRENALDNVHIGLDRVFDFVCNVSRLQTNIYYYDNDIFTRLKGSTGLLGLTSGQIENICDLHGEYFYNYDNDTFEYPYE